MFNTENNFSFCLFCHQNLIENFDYTRLTGIGNNNKKIEYACSEHFIYYLIVNIIIIITFIIIKTFSKKKHLPNIREKKSLKT